MIINRTITEETPVSVVVKGEKGLYGIVDLAGPLGSVSNTLSDLAGYTVEHVRSTLLDTLPHRYGVELDTVAGELCPIRFLVTVT